MDWQRRAGSTKWGAAVGVQEPWYSVAVRRCVGGPGWTADRCDRLRGHPGGAHRLGRTKARLFDTPFGGPDDPRDFCPCGCAMTVGVTKRGGSISAARRCRFLHRHTTSSPQCRGDISDDERRAHEKSSPVPPRSPSGSWSTCTAPLRPDVRRTGCSWTGTSDCACRRQPSVGGVGAPLRSRNLRPRGRTLVRCIVWAMRTPLEPALDRTPVSAAAYAAAWDGDMASVLAAAANEIDRLTGGPDYKRAREVVAGMQRRSATFVLGE